MKQIKVSKLSGAALDWAVAKCDEDSFLYEAIRFGGKSLGMVYDHPDGYLQEYSPSSNWSQGGPIIEREKVGVWWDRVTWIANKVDWPAGGERKPFVEYSQESPLQAAMRSYVASKLGDVVEIPEELC